MSWMRQKVTLSGVGPFFQVHFHIAIDNTDGKERRSLENSVDRLHK